MTAARVTRLFTGAARHFRTAGVRSFSTATSSTTSAATPTHRFLTRDRLIIGGYYAGLSTILGVSFYSQYKKAEATPSPKYNDPLTPIDAIADRNKHGYAQTKPRH